MGKTVRDLLVQALEDLGKKAFKKFKNKLNDWEVKAGFSIIPNGVLEEADAEDLATRIISYYKESYGVEVTLGVLEAIDEKQQAEKLRSALKTVSGFSFQEATKGATQGASSAAPDAEAASGAPARDEEHFVDKHRSKLIQRVSLVSPILDDLYQKKLLSIEAYDKVRSNKTSQDQMRELFQHVESCGNEGKEQLLQSLRHHNLPLIKDLEGR